MIIFQVLPRRWVVERTFGWLNLQRRLSKDYEALCETTETWIYIAMTGLTLRRLARLPHHPLRENNLAGHIPRPGRSTSGPADSNQMEGPVPVWLGNLTNLWFLSLGENPMDGPIPPELGNLTNLRTLGLVDAHL